MVFLALKGGGEVGLPASSVRGFVPDEVLDEVGPSSAAGGDLRALAAEAARRHGLDPALVLAVVGVESAFQPDAVSPKGAQGLMQLMPADRGGARRRRPLRPGREPRRRRSPPGRAPGALRRRPRKALAAYNAGERAVDRHGGVPPYGETRAYVAKVLAAIGPGAMSRRGESGFSLVALMAGITIMLILMAVAVPSWQHVMQDDREQELLFRGGQIADAIGRFQKKNGGALPAPSRSSSRDGSCARPTRTP